ncbi:NitT/TauT family transport system ATP-binding protein [Microvirga lupini]|uniref:NitT/TauT family transport system ATP-binding protein n=1 Tax=Microvirga lupini TaxID=420324 RepID=A0A7W4VLZ2_9HYPH|nr:ATP-binding cassette domain-containing protein [Microvirga lupini]MBB3019185.1 NitT/TauT family transport system ATP-binding protein [Microvirga lupini]
MTMRVVIERKIYPAQEGAPERALFENLSFELADGEVCAIVGPSGIGKSSLLQIVAGLDRDFEGSITGLPQPVGYLFQSPRLLPWRTARQNLELVIPEQPGRAGEWLAQVGLSGSEDVYPQRLSLGMARRVALARALAITPKLLLLDEPFSSLDEETSRGMQRLVAEHMQTLRPTTLLVTHHWHEAAALAQRVITFDGSPARIMDDQPIRQVRAAE